MEGRMQVVANVKSAIKALNYAKSAADRSTSLPYAGYVLLTAVGERLAFTGTDLTVLGEASFPAKVEQEGQIGVPFDLTLGYLGALTSEEVRINVSGGYINLASGRSKARIAGMSADQFPVAPHPGTAIASVSSDVLAKLLRQAEIATSKEDSRFTLQGCLLRISDKSRNKLVIVSTDGHRLSLSEYEGAGFDSFLQAPPDWEDAFLTNAAIKSMLKCLGAVAGTVEILTGEKTLAIDGASGDVTYRALAWIPEKRFPDYERVIPNLEGKKNLRLKTAEFREAVRRVMPFSDSKTHRITIKPCEHGMNIVSDGNGMAEDIVPIVMGDTDFPEIIFNASYLLDFLSVSGSEEFNFLLESQTVAGQMVEPGWRYIVMPMRV
jgi:DNA polymerase-3 subunit beta